MSTISKDRRFLTRDSAIIPIEIKKSDGAYLYDTRGKKYLDFITGWCVGNVGWGNKQITKRLKQFSGPAYVLPDYLYKPWADLAEALAKLLPSNLTKSFRATGGTEAVEIALQAAMSYTGREKFISIKDSYHGHSIGAMSLGLSDFGKWYKNLSPETIKFSLPLNTVTARKIAARLARRDIAAYISEPIILNLGVEIPTREYFDIVAGACKKYGTLLIIDEVATGFGRTGKMFGLEHYGLRPDIVCLAKAITGGYGALGATIATSEVAKAMNFDFSFYSTFGWHPLNVEAALGNIHFWQKNKSALLKNANTIGKLFRQHLTKFPFKSKFELRQIGLAIGLKFSQAGYAATIKQRAIKNRLLVSTSDPYSLVIYPPLNINTTIAKQGLELLKKSI